MSALNEPFDAKGVMPSILIVSHSFPPASFVGGKRALRMARYLTELAWDVEILTLREGYFESLDESLLPEGEPFRILRTHTLETRYWFRRLQTIGKRRSSQDAGGAGSNRTSGRSVGILHRLSRLWYLLFSIPDDVIGWLPFAVMAGLWRARRPTIVLATLPPATNAVAAALVARLRGARLVLDYRDPWSTQEGTAQTPGWRLSVDRCLEKWCVRRASLILTTTDGIRRQQESLDPLRTTVIPNAFDPSDLVGLEPTRFERFTIVYAGTFYSSRTAEPVLRALSLLSEAGRLPSQGLALRVLGVSGEEVSDMAERFGVSDLVEVEPFLPYRVALSRMRAADILLLVVGDTHADMIPAKLFDYLAARRHVLAVAPRGSEAGDMISRLGVGQVVQPEDGRAIADAIAFRFQAPRDDLPGHAGVARFEARRTIESLDRELRAILDEK